MLEESSTALCFAADGWESGLYKVPLQKSPAMGLGCVLGWHLVRVHIVHVSFILQLIVIKLRLQIGDEYSRFMYRS